MIEGLPGGRSAPIQGGREFRAFDNGFGPICSVLGQCELQLIDQTISVSLRCIPDLSS
jgi:hypothetical protein